MRDSRGVSHAIYTRWLGPNHVNTEASEAEFVLQKSIYDGEKKHETGRNILQVPHNLGNLMEYGYQGLNPGSNF